MSPTASKFPSLLRRIVLSSLALGGTLPAVFGIDPPAVTPVESRSETKLTSSRRDVLVDVVERVKSAVVNIHSERTVNASEDPFKLNVMQPQRVNGMGTGIVIDPRGYLITNHHVIDDVNSLRVRLIDGTSLPAKVLATDKQNDLALVKIDPPRPLPTVPLGTATDLFLAEQVIAIGNAYGYEHTVTVGFVSAKNRDVTLNKDVAYTHLIQTQTPINPGNSGGPLFNKKGELVGVNVAIRAGAQNIAFAIPVDNMIAKATDLLAGRRRVGLRNGLIVQNMVTRESDEGMAKRSAVAIAVEPNSPAEKAGFKVGDVIEQAGDIPVTSSIDIERAFIDQPTNNKIDFKVKRKLSTETCTLDLTAGVSLPNAVGAQPGDAIWRRVGFRAVAVGPQTVAAVDPQLRGGLYLQEIAAGGAAAKAGLAKGDVLIGMHLWESLSADNVTFVLNHKDLSTFTPIKVYFVRGGKLKEVLLSPEN
ncbi:MAG: trypsin-like peptidase domain-containing protein [Gemmataceae bacterium]